MRAAGKQEQGGAQLLFVGSPLLDVTSESASPDLLRKYSLEPDGCVAATSGHEDLFRQLFEDPASRLDAGGSALNSALIAKWAMGERGKVAFAGCVGDDDYGARLESELRRSGVEPLFVALPGQRTGVCACLLGRNGQRSMCTRRGASARFSARHLEEGGIGRWLRTSRCIFLVGYFAAHSPDVAEALAETLLPGQLFALSLSAEYICRDFKEVLLALLPKVDVLFGNEGEFRALGLRDPFDAESVASAISEMMASNSDRPGIVVITRGPEDVLLVRGPGPPQYFPVPRITVVDSVGCGDALAGAFLGLYVLTGDVGRAVQAGISAAAEIAQVPGCGPPAKRLTSVDLT